MRTCFVISPFGQPGSKIRKWSDTIYSKIIRPATSDKGYEAFRTLDKPKPGSITHEIAKEIADAELVIADLTGCYPNVIYELALRHATGKPVIQLSDDPSKNPFDIKDLETIQIGTNDDVAEKAKAGLKTQIAAIEEGQGNFSTPFSNYLFSKQYLSAKAYTWEINYSSNLASQWLKQKPKAFKEAVQRYKDEGMAPTNPSHRKLLVEYIAYEEAEGNRVLGDLYYFFRTGNLYEILGHGILKLGTDAPSLVIEVTGEEIRNERVQIKFKQPGRIAEIPPGIREDIPSFDYDISFNLDPGFEGKFSGQLIHPRTNPPLKVGDTKLVLRKFRPATLSFERRRGLV